MKEVKYTNRIGEVFTFTPNENGNINWEGNFEYCSVSFPNDYSKAYDNYWHDTIKKHVDPVEFEHFVEGIHGNTSDYLAFEKYQRDVTAVKNEYHTVDPSGGPFLSVGEDAGFINKQWKGKTIAGFKHVNDFYEIILE
jgi:hypothetical protein